MKRQCSKIFSAIAIACLLLATAPAVNAQCPMCKMSAESNLNAGGTAGKGLNKGIIILFSMPYIMVGTIAFVWYYNRRPEDEVDFVDFDKVRNN